MMNLSSLLPKRQSYRSVVWFDSQSVAGVRFSVRKVSLGQRIELSCQIRELTAKNEFLKAGDKLDALEAALADLLVTKLYLKWGLVCMEGLKIDGEFASLDLLVDRGPESLVNEIVASIRGQLELSEEERKN